MADVVVKITHDVFDIADRLKEIDGAYYPVYNLSRERYEIHWGEGKNSLQLVIPYDSLDSRTIDRVRETRLEYVENALREMDRKNQELVKREEERLKEKARAITEEGSGL